MGEASLQVGRETLYDRDPHTRGLHHSVGSQPCVSRDNRVDTDCRVSPKTLAGSGLG